MNLFLHFQVNNILILGFLFLEKYLFGPAISQQYKNKIVRKYDFNHLTLKNGDTFIVKF